MARIINCPKCEKQGSLQPKKTKHGIYWRVAHYKGLSGETRKVQWCYIGSVLPEQFTNQVITHDYPNFTQELLERNKLKLRFYNETRQDHWRADSSVWYECLTCTQEVAGSIPARSTIFRKKFNNYLLSYKILKDIRTNNDLYEL